MAMCYKCDRDSQYYEGTTETRQDGTEVFNCLFCSGDIEEASDEAVVIWGQNIGAPLVLVVDEHSHIKFTSTAMTRKLLGD